jgi:hypothetical protein
LDFVGLQRSARDAAPDSALHQHSALGLGQAAPNAVWLSDRQCVFAALSYHGALVAQFFRATFPLGPGTATLAVRMEEH